MSSWQDSRCYFVRCSALCVIKQILTKFNCLRTVFSIIPQCYNIQYIPAANTPHSQIPVKPVTDLLSQSCQCILIVCKPIKAVVCIMNCHYTNLKLFSFLNLLIMSLNKLADKIIWRNILKFLLRLY